VGGAFEVRPATPSTVALHRFEIRTDHLFDKNKNVKINTSAEKFPTRRDKTKTRQRNATQLLWDFVY
jgi:hypothetical protein